MSKIDSETGVLKSGYNKFKIFGGSSCDNRSTAVGYLSVRETFLLLSAVERLKIGSRNGINSRKIIDGSIASTTILTIHPSL